MAFTVDAQGIGAPMVGVPPGDLGSYARYFSYHGELVFSNDGIVLNPVTGARIGMYDGDPAAVAVDRSAGRSYLAMPPPIGEATGPLVVVECDRLAFTQLRKLILPVVGDSYRMIRPSTAPWRWTPWSKQATSSCSFSRTPGATPPNCEGRFDGSTRDDPHVGWRRCASVANRPAMSFGSAPPSWPRRDRGNARNPLIAVQMDPEWAQNPMARVNVAAPLRSLIPCPLSRPLPRPLSDYPARSGLPTS